MKQKQIKKAEELQALKLKQEKENAMLAGMVHAYCYPVAPQNLDACIEQLKTRMLAQEQLIRKTSRELEQVNTQLNYQQERN